MLVAYVAAMAFVLVYFAEHYVFDILAWYVYAVVAFVVVGRILERRARCERTPLTWETTPMGDAATYERDGHVATITYNRPEKLNAINGELRRDLNAAWERFRADDDA